MTVIVGAKFGNDVVLISDSRATVTYDGETFPSDNLQKVIGLNDTHTAAYATNDIRAIELVLTEFQHFLSEKPGATLQARLRTFTDFSLAAFSRYNQPFVILLSIKEESGWQLYQFEYPSFSSEEITTITIKGSGSYISQELERYYNNDISPATSLKGKADSLVRSMMSSLNSPQSSSVGGLPQVLMMTNTGVQTVHTGYIEFSPEGEPDSKQIVYENGHWVQKNGSNHTDLVIIPPNELGNVELSEQVFYQYENSAPKELKWWINSFDLYRSAVSTPNDLELGFRLGSLLALEFPQSMTASLYLSAFGPSTEHDLEVVLIEPNRNEQILVSKRFDNTQFPNEYELVEDVTFEMNRKGKHHLVCRINGKEVARKIMYIYHPRNPEPIEDSQRNMTTFLDGYTATELQPHFSLLSATTDGSNFVYDDVSTRIQNQFSVLYYRTYPFSTTLNIVGYLQANPGEYSLAFDFIDAFDHSVIRSGEMDITCTSVTNVKPITIRDSFDFPHPGFYFVRLYVNSKLIAALPLFADGYPPSISYELDDESVAKIAAGEMIILAKRPIDSNDIEE